jgi:hypothetical protein
MSWYRYTGTIVNLAGYSAIFSIRPDIWLPVGKSGTGIRPDTEYKKRSDYPAGYPFYLYFQFQLSEIFTEHI